VGVEKGGQLWIVGTNSPPVQLEGSAALPEPTGCSIPVANGTKLDFDTSGNAYVVASGAAVKFTRTGACEYNETTLDPNASDIYADQSSSSGHLFTAQTGDFEEYDSAGTLLGSFGAQYLSVEGASVAYNPTKDWVYVVQQFEPHPVVAVFGPKVSGTVPDVTAIEAPTSVGVSSAHLEGTVNPRGVASSAHFEWRQPGESWAAAGTSSAQPLVANESPQTVQVDTKALRGGTTYEVRLVTVNSGADRLRAFSGEVKEFTTTQAASAPTVTVDQPSGVTADAATVHGTVDPQGDTADWRVQLSTDPSCAEGFVNEPLQTLDEGSEGPVSVSFDLGELLPSQHYCIQIIATNSAGTTTSEAKQFETEAVLPGEVEIAPAAPREDTSARLNARVNPEGDVLTYRFEYSADGGATWVPLPTQEEAGESRERIVIGEELSGLEPQTSYSYRLGLLEDAAGPTGSLGGEATFTTRAAEPDQAGCPNAGARSFQHADYLRHCRAIELVSNAEKGTQSALFGGVAASGEAALWVITGGAPGSPSGTRSTFRARRTAEGWRSSSIAPPAAQQIGGGTWNYLTEATTPDFSTIIAAPSNRNTQESALVRLREDGGQELLRLFPKAELREPFNGGDATEDAAHVLFINPELEPPQIEEVGGGEPAEVVSIMPDGTPSECGMSSGNEGDNFTGASNSGRGAGRDWRPGYHRLSTVDASRFFFQVKPNGDCGSPALALYQRNRESGETTLIDPGTAASEPHLVRVTPDGRVAYFGTASKLDAADHNSHEDVYRWDETSGESTCVTCAAAPDANLEPGSPIMVSDDFSHVYFTSRRALVAAAVAGDSNIYSLSHGTIALAASLPPDTSANVGLRSGGAQLASDGQALVFPSPPTRTLTSDETTASGLELYRYDGRDGSLECISCRRRGETTSPVGLGWAMSRDGSTVAFETTEALLPTDVNRSMDVYEWRDGRVSLITDGISEGARPEVGGVSADGTDVFFSAVQAGLTGFERDAVRNDYDARIGGGFLPPTPAAHCVEDSCQGPLLPPPLVENPASSTFRGLGNLRQRPRCRRKRTNRHRHCATKRRHRHRHHHRQGGGRKEVHRP
jgi:hypothetical protein